MQRAGIQQRGANGSVQFEKNGGSISPTKPDGSRTLTSGYGSGSVSPLAASPRVKKFDGMSPEQFGKSAAARQGRGNAFTRSASPAATAMGPAQKALADFNAANPNVRTQSEIDGIGAKYQINRDKLANIRAQKQVNNYAAQSDAMRAHEAAAPPRTAAENIAEQVRPGVLNENLAREAEQAKSLRVKNFTAAPSPRTDAENLAEQIRPGVLNENRAREAGTPRAISPGSPPLANAAGQAAPIARPPLAAATGQPSSFLPKLTQPSPSLAPLLTSPPQPLIAGARAKGGPVEKGKAYLVGEKGPEIVIPKQNGTVIPNHAIKPSLLVGR